jgi:hypothetical protein
MRTAIFGYEACLRLLIMTLIVSAFITVSGISNAAPQQTAEPRPRSSPTPSPSPSPQSSSKSEEKTTGVKNDKAAHKPEPRPTEKPKLSEMVIPHDQGATSQGAEPRPTATVFPASPSQSHIDATKRSKTGPSQQPEPRPTSSPKPKKNIQPDE